MKSATMTADEKTVFAALRGYKHLAGMFKRGGCIESYKEAQGGSGCLGTSAGSEKA